MTRSRQPDFSRLIALAFLVISFSVNAANPLAPLPSDSTSANFAIPTPSPSPPESPRQLWNLQNADIDAVIEAVSKETGKNFIIDPRVQGKITIVSAEPIGGNEVYQVFLSALQVLGYAAVPVGDMIKIVPDVNAKSLSTPLVTNANPGSGDELVVRILTLKNTAANQMLPAIQSLLPENSSATVYPAANALILSGRATSISRVVQIAQSLDQSSSSQTQIYPLRYANAPKVVSLLNTLQSADRAAGKVSNITFAADEQSNSILMNGPASEQVHSLALINKLDSPPMNEAGGTQVIHLNYLKADKLAPILAQVSHSTYLGVVAGGDTTSVKSASSTFSTAANVSVSTTPTPTRTGEEGNDQKISIAAESDTNSIIISAPATMMGTLKAVINDLDVRPAQVLVEAVIATVAENIADELGVEWAFSNVPGTNTAGTNTSGSSPTVPTAFQAGIGIIQKGDLQAIIHFLLNTTTSDILATPSVVVMNNQKAAISDGQNVSFETTSAAQTPGNPVSPFTTFDRQDVTLSLQVTPQISPNNTVQLTLVQQNNNFTGPVTNVTPTSPYNTSKINTTVLVSSGDILVLGGLINQDTEVNVEKVPLLGDIPFVGKYLFSFKVTTVQKKNLMVFIRPIILNNPVSNYDVSNVRYNFIRNQQLRRQRGEDLITDENEKPLLSPAFNPKVKLPAPFPNNGPVLLPPPPPPPYNGRY